MPMARCEVCYITGVNSAPFTPHITTFPSSIDSEFCTVIGNMIVLRCVNFRGNRLRNGGAVSGFAKSWFIARGWSVSVSTRFPSPFRNNATKSFEGFHSGHREGEDRRWEEEV